MFTCVYTQNIILRLQFFLPAAAKPNLKTDRLLSGISRTAPALDHPSLAEEGIEIAMIPNRDADGPAAAPIGSGPNSRTT